MMRLRRLDIRGFGKLRGTIALDAGVGHLGLVVERNEAGKSTLAAGILAALYGLEDDRRRARGGPTPRDSHRPWKGSEYALRLELDHEGADYVIERDFEDDTVRVLSGSQDVTSRFQQGSSILVGEKLTGLTRHQFRLSFFVAQGTLVWGDAGELGDALQRAADSHSGRSTAARALQALDHGLRNYRGLTLSNGGHVDTEVQRCEDRLQVDRARLAALESEREGIAELLAELEREDGHRHGRDLRRRLLRIRHAKTRAFELDQSLRRVAELNGQVERMRSELRAADPGFLDEPAIATWEQTLRDLEAQRDRVRVATEDTRSAEAAVSAALATRQAIGLARRPTEDDLAQLARAVERIESTAEELTRTQTDNRRERAGLATRGIAPEEGLELARCFEGLEDPDREQLASHRLVRERQAERAAEFKERIDTRKRERALIRRSQQLGKHFGIWCLVVGMLPMLVAISMSGILPFSPWFLYAPSLFALVLGIGVFTTGSNWRRQDSLRLQGEIQELRAEDADLAESSRLAEERWERLAQRLGLPTESMADAFERYRMAEGALARLRALERRAEELETGRARALSEVAELWTLLGEQPQPDALRPQVERVRQGLDAVRRVDEANAHAADRQRRRDEAAHRLTTLESGIAADLTALGIAATRSSLGQAVPELHRRIAHARRLREVRETTLPQLEAQLPPPESVESRRAAKAEWEAQVAQLHGQLTAAQQTTYGAELEQPLSGHELDAALKRLDEEEESARAHELERRTEARTFLTRFELEAPPLRDAILRHADALRRAQGFAASVRLAHQTLSEIATERHRNWASALNERCRDHLQALASDVTNLHFAEDLSLRLEQHGHLLTAAEAMQQLSVGALDGVYLAARLAVADHLHADLPLVLDDPFANADDRRLLAGLRMLLDHVVPQRQVLLLACQDSRYRWALDQLGNPASVVLLTLTRTHEASAG